MSTTLEKNKIQTFVEGLTPTTLNFDQTTLDEAQHFIQDHDFPTTRQEAWKYTRVQKIANKTFQIDKTDWSSSEEFVIDQEAYQFVFVNGCFNEQLSSSEFEEGLSISLLSSEEEIHTQKRNITDVFQALNVLYAQDGLKIGVDRKVKINKSIEIIHILHGEHKLANLRHQIQVEQGAEAKITLSFYGKEAKQSFTNTYTEVNVAENAHLTIDKLQYEDESCFHIANEFVQQARNATFTINTITLNGGLVRNNLWIEVQGENGNTNLNGAYLLLGDQHVDNHTTVDHQVAHCESNELYKGVINDQATAVFNGKVFVRKDAQKINAFQSNGNVLLSDSANVNSKPELEIYADDVKCSHGSTTGQLDDEAIFYLRARGISEKAAKQLMVSAFIGDVLDKIENEAFLAKVHTLLEERFGWEF